MDAESLVRGYVLCRGLQVELGICQLTIDGYLFELGGVHLILGVEWLSSLGEVRVDWGMMVMRFLHGSKEVEIQKDPSLSRSLVSLRSLSKTVDIESCGAVRTATGEDTASQPENKEVMPAEVGRLLAKYQDIFNEPQGLPPRSIVFTSKKAVDRL